MSRIVYTVQWAEDDRVWRILRGKAAVEERLGKQSAVDRAAELARWWWSNGQPAQVVVKNQSGRIAFERTYGRDPKRSKG